MYNLKKKIIQPLGYDEPIVDKEFLALQQQRALDIVGRSKRVLEVGCSTGSFTKHLRDQECTVTCIEIDEESARKAKGFAESVIVGDVEEPAIWLKLPHKFEVILFMHVLEHLVDPWRVLREARTLLAEGGFIIILIPNIACWQTRQQLFFKGDFQYQKCGILDLTHLRFFTFFTAQELIREAGYTIEKKEVVGWTVPFAGKLKNLPLLRYLAPMWERAMIRLYPNLCGAFFLFKAVINKEINEGQRLQKD
ncbi:MAG: class I SAM-dependent methyltransferase [Candidatus Omnitrophota bacterium]|nr:class I SAM-dependent methyltransferase [Candidatus Omnitrophota bacterium]